MKKDSFDAKERLIRVLATRRGTPVELLVHYEITRVDGCDTYRLFRLEEQE